MPHRLLCLCRRAGEKQRERGTATCICVKFARRERSRVFEEAHSSFHRMEDWEQTSPRGPPVFLL